MKEKTALEEGGGPVFYDPVARQVTLCPGVLPFLKKALSEKFHHTGSQPTRWERQVGRQKKRVHLKSQKNEQPPADTQIRTKDRK